MLYNTTCGIGAVKSVYGDPMHAIRLSMISLGGLNASKDTATLHMIRLHFMLATKQVNTAGKFGIDDSLESVVIPAAMERQIINAVFSAIAVSLFVRNVPINKAASISESLLGA
jgi:hypothetical protein